MIKGRVELHHRHASPLEGIEETVAAHGIIIPASIVIDLDFEGSSRSEVVDGSSSNPLSRGVRAGDARDFG
ncbi:hypothetical protein VPH35_058983 [Triticum aestivum]